jgi:competence protein ComEC
VPSQRALIMLILASVAILSRRRPAPARILAFTAAAIFVVDPVASMTPGFRLSFAAVALLLAFPCTYARPCPGPVYLRKPVSVVQQLVRMQLVLLFGLTPLTILLFQRLALLAPVANLMTVPIFSLFTVPLTLAGMVADPVSDAAGTALIKLAAASVLLIERIIAWVAAFPYADTTVAGVNGFDSRIMCVIFLPAIWILLPRAWPGRWIAVLAVLVLLLHRPATPPHGCVDTHVLDVGQGQAIVVQSRRHTLVFDTGRSYRDGGSAAEQLVLPFLRYRGIASIDRLIASHADDDHAGGVPAMVREIKIGQILAGESLKDPGQPVRGCRAGQAWDADGVRFEMLHPLPEAGLTGNNASCVLAVAAGRHRMLLTGDIELAAEESLLARESLSTASVVLIPHHGSLTSSSPPFVNRVRPDLAIASVGYANRWGFPKEAVTRRWEGIGARVLDTAGSGAISFRLCAGDGVSRLRLERLRGQHIWHDTPEH